MTYTTQVWLWVGFIGMVFGTIVFGAKAIAKRRKEGMEFALVSFFITLWAASLYLSMILGETVLTDFKGQHEIFWGRYVDWVVTTPLLLLDLGVVAGCRPKLIGGVIGADIFMILTGLVATLEGSPTNYLWYVISSGAFLAILIALFTEFSDTAPRRPAKVNKLYLTLRNVLTVLWIAYPIVWILGPEGFTVLSVGVETACYAILDVCAKVGFGLILNGASSEVLAQASNSHNIMEAVHSYIESEPVRSQNR
ncbi:MAG: rhodopsin [Leptolyngbya sp. ERB_1_1]